MIFWLRNWQYFVNFCATISTYSHSQFYFFGMWRPPFSRPKIWMDTYAPPRPTAKNPSIDKN